MKVVFTQESFHGFTQGNKYEVLDVMIDRHGIYMYWVIDDFGKEIGLLPDEAHIPLKKQSHYRWRKIAKAQGKKRKRNKFYRKHMNDHVYITAYHGNPLDPFDFKITRTKYTGGGGRIDTIRPIRDILEAFECLK